MRRGESVTGGRILRWLQRTAIAVTAAVPLVVCPGISTPFSTPKIIALGAWVFTAMLLLLAFRPASFAGVPGQVQALVFCWSIVASLSARLGDHASVKSLAATLLPVACFVVLAWLRPNPGHLAMALVCSAVAIAGIAWLQYLGWDPFALGGWTPAEAGSGRMRVYATLGNPNFVAAFLSGALPLAWIMAKRRAAAHFSCVIPVFVCICLLGAGMLATGSRAPIVGGAAVFVWAALSRIARLLGRRHEPSQDRAGDRVNRPRTSIVVSPALLMLVPLVAVGIALAFFSPARSLAETVRGRLYLWQTVAPHVREVPLFGFGPGSFELKYAVWETARIVQGGIGQPPSRFRGIQDHAHNDYLETLVETGFPGLALFLVTPVLIVLRQNRGAERSLVSGASAGVLVLMAIALVDFPFHRPAESFLFWNLLAVVHLSYSTSSGDMPVKAVSAGSSPSLMEV